MSQTITLEIYHSLEDVNNPFTKVATTIGSETPDVGNCVYRRDLVGIHKTPFIQSLDGNIEVDEEFLKDLGIKSKDIKVSENPNSRGISLVAHLEFEPDEKEDEELSTRNFAIWFGNRTYSVLEQFDR